MHNRLDDLARSDEKANVSALVEEGGGQRHFGKVATWRKRSLVEKETGGKGAWRKL